MKTVLFTGLAGFLAMAPGTAFAANDSAAGSMAASTPVDVSFASPTALIAASQGVKTMHRKGGHRMGGRKIGGHRMKRMGGHRMKGHHGRMRFKNGAHVRKGRMGHKRGYRKPHRGFQLPRTFIQPSFFIGNFGHFGLSRPSRGYGWSRYYDDAVLTDRRGVVHDTRYNLDWDRYNQGYNDGYRASQATYDQSVFMSDDRVVASPNGYRGSPTTYKGDWNGAYQQDGSYKGDWQGTYRGGDGRTYEGQYSGTFIGNGNVAPAETSYPRDAPHWQAPVDNGRYADDSDLAYLERCRKSSGIGGAIVGGAIGALAGNRIAGRGNRLGGSLIGGGLGALAGGAIEQGTDRCRKLLKRYGGGDRHVERRAHRPAQHRGYAPRRQHISYGYPQQTYPSGWQGGYYPAYYYPQAQPTVTTIVIQSAPVTTTTTTTYIEEEVIYTKAKYTPKKRWKPAPKRKWKPRRKPAPILKGCQQAHC